MLAGKVAVVTGATRGIGRAIALLYAKSGAVVYGIGRSQKDLESLGEAFSNIYPVQADVCDMEGIKEILMQAQKTHGHIDILVNNAGVMKDALLGMISEREMEKSFQTNVYAVILLTQLASRLMKRQKAGSIINMASIIGIQGNAGQSVYAATKGAVISFTKSAAKELAPSGIRVNAIAPGIIQTDLLADVPEQKLSERISKIQLGRIGTPEDVAAAALFLASDQSRYMTGQVLTVDGMTIL